MAESLPQSVSRNQMAVWFRQFRKLRIRLPRDVRHWLSLEFKKIGKRKPKKTVRALHTQNPLLGMMRTLLKPEWRTFIVKNRWIRKEVSEVLYAVWFQQVHFADALQSHSRTASIFQRKLDEISLVARRHLLRLAGQGEQAAFSPKKGDFTGWFPRTNVIPGTRSYDATDADTWLDHHQKITNLLSHKYLYSRGSRDSGARLGLGSDDSDYEDMDFVLESEPELAWESLSANIRRGKSLSDYHRDRESPVNPSAYRQYEREAACTSFLSVHSYTEPAGLLLMRYLCNEAAEIQADVTDLAGFHLVAMLSLEHGIPPKDVLHLGINGNVTSFGAITKSILLLNVGSPFYKSGARAFDASRIYLPLSREAWILFAKARRFYSKSKEPKTIGELIGFQPKAFRNNWRKFVRKNLHGFSTQSSNLHQVWEHIALIDASIPRPIASLLVTRPLRGTHAECSYVSVRHNELLEASHKIRSALRQKAGLPKLQLAAARSDIFDFRTQRGTVCPTLKEYWMQTEALVDDVTNHNQAVGCVVRFLRGLSVRAASAHFPPAYYAVSLPEPAFELLDKSVNSRDRVRYIPITPEIGELVTACAEIFNVSPELLYESNGEFPYVDLIDSSEIDKIIMDGGSALSAGRTAFFSALLRLGCGEAIRNFLMGHGASVFAPYSEHGLLSVGDWIRETRAPVESIYHECRVNEIATKLAAKVRSNCRMFSGKRNTDEVPSLPRHGISFYGTNLDAGSISPPLPLEHAMLGEIRKALAAAKIQGTPQALACQLAYAHGIPLRTILSMSPYIRFRDFVAFNGSVWLLMPMEHQDKGGLSIYPIKICERNTGNPVVEILHKMWRRLRAINLGVADSRLADRLVFSKSSVDSESAFQKARRTSGKDEATHYAYHASSPLTEKSLEKAITKLLPWRSVRSLLAGPISVDVGDRLSEIVCAWQHPAIVLGALRGKSKRGLNNYCFIDVFRQINADETPRVLVFGGEMLRSGEIAKVSPLQIEKCEQIMAAMIERGLPAARHEKTLTVAKILAENGVHPDGQNLAVLLKKFKISVGTDEVFAARLKGGYAVESRSLPLYSPAEQRTLFSNVLSGILSKKLRSPSFYKQSSRRAALKFYVSLLAGGGFRLSEPANLRRDQAVVIAGHPYVFVKRGKTSSSRRIVTSLPFSPSGSFSTPLQKALSNAQGTNLPRALLALSRKESSDGKLINRELAKASDGRFSAHDFRHHLAVQSVQNVIFGHLRHGNYHTAMMTLSRRLGHGSMSVTEYSYIGTAVTSLRLPASEGATPPSWGGHLIHAKMRVCHGHLTQKRFGQLIRHVASGELAERQGELRRLRRYENQIRSWGRSTSKGVSLTITPHDSPLGTARQNVLTLDMNVHESLREQAAEIIELALRFRVSLVVRVTVPFAKILMTRFSTITDNGVKLKSAFRSL